jgi:hypothetical protein
MYLGRPAMSLRTLHRRVREVAAWRRPRLVAQRRRDAGQVVADLRQAITDLPDGAVMLAEDETHINLLPWVRSTWIVKGARQRVMTPAPTGGAACSARSTCARAAGSTRSPGGRSAQRSSSSWSTCSPATRPRRWWCWCWTTCLSTAASWSGPGCARTRACGCCTACYSPHHNPVERIWGALKVALANSPTLTIAGRIGQVHAFFRQRTNAQLLATAAPYSSPWLPEGHGQNLRQAALGSGCRCWSIVRATFRLTGSANS